MARAEPTEELVVAGRRIAPGERLRIELPVSSLATSTEVTLPFEVVRGLRSGPTVWISAAIHGDELNGVEIVGRVLRRLDPRRLRGAVLAVPIVNVLGFLQQSRYLPDRRDLNRSFPGSAGGSLGSRIAHLFMREIVGRCSFGIDLHTGSNGRTNLSQIRASLSDEGTRRLALAFGAPVVIDAPTRGRSLREAAVQRGVRTLLFEGGEALRFDEQVILSGTRGVLAVLAELDMVRARRPREARAPFVAGASHWVRAARGGVLHLGSRLGDLVLRGQVIGEITDTFGARRAEVRATDTGMVVGQATNPLVHRGDAIVHLATAAAPAERRRGAREHEPPPA